MGEDERRRGDYALAFFNHVESQVGLATNKTGLLIAANAFLIGAYLTLMKDFSDKIPAGVLLQGWYGIVGSAFLLMVAATCCSLWGVYPTRKPKPVGPDHPNLMFFGHAARLFPKWQDFVRAFEGRTASGCSKTCWLRLTRSRTTLTRCSNGSSSEGS